ncbi:hypothetical protein [Thiocapsa bogorovii]|uniref:hypothetical protein n=1 Tax=Thiocapsa bogorovii TaxID=521689 RepID=UPI001E47577D|nr:hypothetical protein [Thiocapsa bogorovii]UHD14660.1 hypothetical protein LT988_15315 [Thiocapsa bogorovii]
MSLGLFWVYTSHHLENFDFSAPCDRVMMRDYKFRQTEWPRRKARSKTLKVIAGMLAALAIALLGYAGWQWFSNRPADDGVDEAPDSRVIPLTIPPKQSTSADGADQPAPPTEQTLRPGQN